MKARTLAFMLAVTAFAFTASACSSDEEPGGGHDSPESVKLFNAETHEELPTPYTLPSGSTTRIEVHYYNEHGEDINDQLIAEHFTSLTFDPATFATVTSVTDAKFQRDVLVNADPGSTAGLSVGYGHDEAADTRSFDMGVVTASEGTPVARTR